MPNGTPPCDWTFTPTCSTDEWDGYTQEVRDAATRFATWTMWSATGRRYGLCEITVRPCGRYCEGCDAGYFWSYGTWVPYLWNGVWRNCWCGEGEGAGCQNCAPACQIWLPGPVDAITNVSIDGATVDPTTYRLDLTDGAYWLVRQHTAGTDNECWPMSQNFDHPLGQPDTMSVTYDKGIPVPEVIADAAAILAVEWARGCVGAACRLPNRVQALTRQGVTMTMPNIDELLKRGLTGITEVDQVITADNPYGVRGRPRLASVETERRVRYVDA